MSEAETRMESAMELDDDSAKKVESETTLELDRGAILAGTEEDEAIIYSESEDDSDESEIDLELMCEREGRIKKTIELESTPELIILLSEYMYRRNEEEMKTSKKKMKKSSHIKQRRRLIQRRIHRVQSDPDYKSDKRDDFYLPTDLARLIHKFLLLTLRGFDDFELVKVIGRGSMGKIIAVRDKNEIALFGKSKIYAMKVLKKKLIVQRDQIRYTMDELRFYKMIAEETQCPFLVRMHYAFETDNRLCFILDFYGGGDLFFHLKKQKRFPESTACVIVAEMTSAIMHLHDKFDIVHRNLKPEVVMLQTDGHCALIDCGASKQLSGGETSTTFCGTPEYLAPEFFTLGQHGKPVDWWAIGILLYELIVGIPPFYDQNIHQMYRKIQESPLLIPSALSKSTQDLIKRFLHRTPAKRLGSQSNEEIKHHPFWMEHAPGVFTDSDDFWNKLNSYLVEPPYKPETREDKADPFGRFDPGYLREKPALSPTFCGEPMIKKFREEGGVFEYF